jgi:hypothetical protein
VAAIAALREKPSRIVIPVGSGMSAAGVLAGMAEHHLDIPVLGVMVGADPRRRLDTWAPGWEARLSLVASALNYEQRAPVTALGDLELDPIYEAKALPFLRFGDLLWVVGCRVPPGTPGKSGAAHSRKGHNVER